MKRIAKMTAMMLIVVLIAALTAVPVFAAPDYDVIANSVVRVVGFDNMSAGTGTAFVIAQSGSSTYLVTNRHVIMGILYDSNTGQPIEVYDFSDNFFVLLDDVNDVRLTATPIILSNDINDGMDVAILRVDTGLSNRNVLTLAPAENERRGNSIHVAGFPGSSDYLFGSQNLPSSEADVTVAPGTITNINQESGGVRYLQHDASTSSGSSGGPVINDSGAVIGVHTLGTEGFKGAVYIDYVIEQCERLGIPIVTTAGSRNAVTDDSAASDDESEDAEAAEEEVVYDTSGSSNTAIQLLTSYWWVLLAVVAVLGIVMVLVMSRPSSAAKHAPMPVSAPAPAAVSPPIEASPYAVTQALPSSQKPVNTPAKSSAAASLICTKGNFAGTTFPVNGSLSIGRDPLRCQIVFPNDTKGISSMHCGVSQNGAGVTLTDKGSTYGTFLSGGRKLNPGESVSLNYGDSFYLADNNIEFRVI